MNRSTGAALLLCWALINGLWIALPRGSYDHLVIHHSAGDGDFRTIRRSHRARGWFETGYHFVLSNGSTRVALGHLEPTRRYRLGLWSVATRSWRHNRSAIHLCVVGNFEEREVPIELRQALGHAVATLQREHRIRDDQILLHRDCSPTACPGRNITRGEVVSWAALAENAPVEMQRQHTRSIRGRRLGRGAYLFTWVALHSMLTWLWARRSLRAARTGQPVRGSLSGPRRG